MSVRVLPGLLLLPLVVGFTTCNPGDDEDSDTDPAAEPRWFHTCGDPVCSEYSGPTEGVALCTSEAVGEGCSEEGATCDPEDSCNAMLTCATEDPTQQTGGCPISRRAYKHDIRYLSDAERAAAAAQVLEMPLATWAYNHEPAGQRAHLGFIIDDLSAASPAVAADGNHVDLYGYTSLTVAAVQGQAVQLQAAEARIARLESELAELKALIRAR